MRKIGDVPSSAVAEFAVYNATIGNYYLRLYTDAQSRFTVALPNAEAQLQQRMLRASLAFLLSVWALIGADIVVSAGVACAAGGCAASGSRDPQGRPAGAFRGAGRNAG